LTHLPIPYDIIHLFFRDRGSKTQIGSTMNAVNAIAPQRSSNATESSHHIHDSYACFTCFAAPFAFALSSIASHTYCVSSASRNVGGHGLPFAAASRKSAM
jgi:hypothetical protein